MTVGTDLDGKPIVSDQLVPIRLPRVEKVAVNTDTGEILENLTPIIPLLTLSGSIGPLSAILWWPRMTKEYLSAAVIFWMRM